MTARLRFAPMRAWVERQGGMLIAPRQTVAGLDEDDGRRDGTWALLAWLLAVHVVDVFRAVARMLALRNFDALLGGVAEIAFSLLPPFVATFVIELVLGRDRAYRAGTCLAAMIAVGVVLRLVQIAGIWHASPAWIAYVVAGLAAVGSAFYVRDAVPMRRAEDR